MSERGRLLYEYRPPRAHPILYASLMLFAVVFVTGSIENLLRGARPAVFLWYALPFIATLAVTLALARGTVRIYAQGIAPGRPLVLRWWRPFVRWDELAAVYPSYYDVTGAFVSPFASSDGKVTQMGLGLEWPDGRVETVRFTPTRFTIWKAESKGFKGAIAAVRHAFADRPLVQDAESFDEDEATRLRAEAGRPFLPFIAIVLLIASAAPVLVLLVNFTPLPIPVALALSFVAPLAVALRSYVQSQRRNAILNRLSKAAEYQRSLEDRREQGA